MADSVLEYVHLTRAAQSFFLEFHGSEFPAWATPEFNAWCEAGGEASLRSLTYACGVQRHHGSRGELWPHQSAGAHAASLFVNAPFRLTCPTCNVVLDAALEGRAVYFDVQGEPLASPTKAQEGL